MELKAKSWVAASVPGWGIFFLAALMIHVAGIGLSALWRFPDRGGDETSDLLLIRMLPPQEGEEPLYMASVAPAPAPPEGQDGEQDFGESPVPNDTLTEAESAPSAFQEADILSHLAAERDALRAELDKYRELAQAPLPQLAQLPPPPKSEPSQDKGLGPPGAVRELDLSGFPQPVVDEIMERYGLRVVNKMVRGGSAQNFLSSASGGRGDRYFGGVAVPAGVYEVFQLSRRSVGKMSQLEEQALRDRGMEPLKSRIIRIVFGIVEADGGHDLGVKSLEAKGI